MNATNLGLVFTCVPSLAGLLEGYLSSNCSPVVFGEDEGATLESAMHSAEVSTPSPLTSITHTLVQDTILSLIIANVQFIFEGLPVDPSTPLNRSRAASLSQVEQAQRIASRSSLHLVSTSEDGSLMPRSAFVPYPRSASDTEVLSSESLPIASSSILTSQPSTNSHPQPSQRLNLCSPFQPVHPSLDPLSLRPVFRTSTLLSLSPSICCRREARILASTRLISSFRSSAPFFCKTLLVLRIIVYLEQWRREHERWIREQRYRNIARTNPLSLPL
jgi:hypothetical protein